MKSNPNKNLKEINKFSKRDSNWSNGAIVYQVLVDRFFKPEDFELRKSLYKAPKILKEWSDLPKPGPFVEKEKYYQHELEYWGGTLKSLQSKLDYIKDLGVNVLYLNPIHDSLSNHKYDATDYMQISPEFGNFEDLKSLIKTVHNKNMKIMLDGVFNHVGVNNIHFQEALKGLNNKRKWFDFNDNYSEGYRIWAGSKSLPELNLEEQAVCDYIYKSDHSVIKSYLNKGIDGWRLDVAHDLGYKVLSELTNEAHKTKEDSVIIGEIWNYPKDWLETVDGLMNFTFRELILSVVNQSISVSNANSMLEKIIMDSDMEGLLKSWIVLDNHDVARLRHLLPNSQDQKLAQILQFTLPGSPNVYYGTELGMDGGIDPCNRAPMDWNLVNEDNKYLKWMKSLIDLHSNERALRIGDFISFVSEKTLCFERRTDKVEETVIVVLNPTDKEVNEKILVRDSKIMNFSELHTIAGNAKEAVIFSGFLNISLEPKSFILLKPDVRPHKSYTPYKRV